MWKRGPHVSTQTGAGNSGLREAPGPKALAGPRPRVCLGALQALPQAPVTVPSRGEQQPQGHSSSSASRHYEQVGFGGNLILLGLGGEDPRPVQSRFGTLMMIPQGNLAHFVYLQ